MRRSRHVKTVLLISLISFFHLLSGCKKEDNSVVDQPANYQLSLSQAAPMQIVTLESDKNVFTELTYKGTLGSKEVSLCRVDENTLAFLVPDDLTPGNLSLSMNLPDRSATFPLTVEAAPTPLTSGQLTNLVNDAIGRLDGYIAQADSIAAMGWMPEADKQRVRNLKDSLTKHLFSRRIRADPRRIPTLFLSTLSAGRGSSLRTR